MSESKSSAGSVASDCKGDGKTVDTSLSNASFGRLAGHAAPVAYATRRTPFGVLLVDDEEGILESLELTLQDDCRIFKAHNGLEGLEVLAREDIALVIADQVMPKMSGVEFLEKVNERQPEIMRILLTGYADMSSLMRAVNEGRIYRYIQKPWEPDELRLIVKRALEQYALAEENHRLSRALTEANERLQRENVYLRREVERRYSFAGILGSSPAMQKVFEVLEKVAATDATVLLTGETGTGKDLIARAIHYSGPRKPHSFIAQNCAALPDTLLESELFGHKRGAFTGAHADKKGLFELAHHGTIFLDEIGETKPSMQVRLLRVLQNGEVRPLGGSDSLHVDVRIIAATNRDLRREVREGNFREDLYYRLRVVEIHLPALRERKTDIPELAHHFLELANKKMDRHLGGFSNAAMHCLMEYRWRGNIRELENEIERIVALAGDADTVREEMLSEHIREEVSGASPEALLEPASFDLNQAVDQLKRRMIRDAIQQTGSKSRAAERLGIPRQSLQKMMKRLEMSDDTP